MASIPRLLASSSFPSFNPAGEERKEAVYVAAVPLRASKGPAQIAVSAAYSIGLWDLQHWMVIIKPSHHHSHAYAFDFQPKDPEDIQVVLAALTQKQVPGVVLKRKLARLPKRRCWFVGFSTCSNQEDDTGSINVAENFTNAWNTDLIIGKRDCRHFTNDLVIVLTGKYHILDRIQQ
ncbi:hypothetical protein ZOSMA_101G00620 [Zostera marina]|uniref:Uncharacterized protein n=1 Tax=Zostera marina TaxID=29655 RepID=A0A0K9Q5B0_ZOSMR|nr:hypothetical protein ZOSMA_101G00620 [Zostera marina]